jgi:GDPmannose 4,6-dehydratase
MTTMTTNELDKVWLVTGVCGQDGSTFCEMLLEKGYKNVHGTMRRSASFNTQNIDHIFHKLKLHYADLTDAMNIHNIIARVRPHYIVNFAAQSHVKVSHDLENYTFQTNTLGVLNILQSVRTLGLEKTTKIYQASTSEEYGNVTDGSFFLNEESLKVPVSVYGISKLAAENLCNMYRDAYGMFVVCSTLFNHEGPRRGGTFVTQKIANHVARYHLREEHCVLELGNLNARRDWGYTPDYCKAIYAMLMQETPQNYVIATGETHSVREFVELAFKEVGVKVKWVGSGVHELGIDADEGHTLVCVNPKYYRDIDIECLIGDASKAHRELNWTPSTTFQDLVKIMVKASIERAA